ncbi:MarR family transcriptional regulator [Dactylosporangium vinaceum]|uniref:MarR family winged helix-turn-helix transcriptional regulator n=1 Tax=Dactylosporangium vinaceum TaxID=53362 RepID=A0ABV5MSE9_9ACTN|nr:MarR family transcriptional regulator [Dactylosporangium vinaceum]UAC00629.1 MarR family transcriptional regulator [Dactylosporangium vinaceum]
MEPEEWALWNDWMHAQRLLIRELDGLLQRDYGISKAEFSVLVSLQRADGGRLRVGELAESLDWDKSRVAHQLTRMEHRELVERTTDAAGRRTGIGLTAKGRSIVEQAVVGHGQNIRRYFFEPATPEQSAAIHAWSRQLIDRIENRSTDGPPSVLR